MSKATSVVPAQRIEAMILLIRGEKVMLDDDLATLYGVETKYLKRQVRRNIDRFPSDFMFRLTGQEVTNLRCQLGTSRSWGGKRYTPYVFSEQGVAMLSSVLRSKQAVQVNIEIMRAFVKLRQLLATHVELAQKLDAMEKKFDAQFRIVESTELVPGPVANQRGSRSRGTGLRPGGNCRKVHAPDRPKIPRSGPRGSG